MLSPEVQMKRLETHFRTHPEEYPEVPGKAYYVVLCDTFGTPVRPPQVMRFRVLNQSFTIMALQPGQARQYVAFRLARAGCGDV